MTARGTWKAFERTVAHFFGGERTPLSGGNSKITRADVIHDKLFIECKYRQSFALLKTWDKAKEMAQKEGKTPVLAIKRANEDGWFIVIHCDDFSKL